MSASRPGSKSPSIWWRRAEDRIGEWLVDGSMISLHLRENTVDVFIRSPPAAPEPEAPVGGGRGSPHRL